MASVSEGDQAELIGFKCVMIQDSGLTAYLPTNQPSRSGFEAQTLHQLEQLNNCPAKDPRSQEAKFMLPTS